MKPWVPWAVAGGLAFALGWQWAGSCRDDAERKQERKTYERRTDSLQAVLRTKISTTDTILKRIPIDRIRVLRDSTLTDSLRRQLASDSTTRDSLDTAIQVIGAQDSLITSQRVSIRTLNDAVVSQAEVMHLYRLQRNQDSIRIAQLDRRERGWRIAGLKLPKFRCGIGAGVTYDVANGKMAVGPTAACVLSF